MLEIGSVIDGKYKILSVIGHGGMSTVYLAINEKVNKPWAIKEIRKRGPRNDMVLRKSIMTEIDMLKKLNHKGLPSIIDVIEKEDNFLIVMDYIEGRTLKSLVKEDGVQSQEKVVEWAIQLCDILQYLHEREHPIIYRDMKPSNVMLQSDGNVVLIDFGTAREFKDYNLEDTTCLGTQGYAAPEQFGGNGQSDARTDIYSLGVTIYQLVTGHSPAEPPYEIRPISEWNQTLSTGLEQIIMKCTQKNPKDRYQSARDLRFALENYLEFDKNAIIKYKKRFAIFVASLVISAGLLTSALVSHVIDIKNNKLKYSSLMEKAQYTSNREKSLLYYTDGIKLEPSSREAYLKVIEQCKEDNSLDEEERQILEYLINSEEIKKLKSADSQGYADYCYEVANMIRHYDASTSFRTISRYYQNAIEEFPETEANQGKMLECSFSIEHYQYKEAAQKAAIEHSAAAGFYREYWQRLLDYQTESERIGNQSLSIRIYTEILSNIVNYANQCLKDGVDTKEFEESITHIEQEFQNIGEDIGVEQQEDVEQLQNLMGSVRDVLESFKMNQKN